MMNPENAENMEILCLIFGHSFFFGVLPLPLPADIRKPWFFPGDLCSRSRGSDRSEGRGRVGLLGLSGL